MNEVIAKYDRMAQQSGEARARLIAPDLINEIKRLEKRVAELEAGLKASEEKMRLHAGDCCSLNTEVELFRSQRDDAHDELKAANERVVELEGQAKLAEWARHDEGCSYPVNEKYGCRCGLLEAQEALAPKDGE